MSEDLVEPSSPEMPETLQRLSRIHEAGTLRLKGYSISDIGEIMELGATAVRSLIREFDQMVEFQINSDPYFLEKIQQHTLRSLMQLDEISKETWETINVATDNGMVSTRLQGLKLALELTSKRAQLLQLTGQQRADTEYIAKMQKVESVNQMLSNILRDVISECPRCREQARAKLAEAFQLMNEVEHEDAEVVSDD
jgi:hypothetical protein